MIRAEINWKCELTGQIGSTQSESAFKVLNNPQYNDSSSILVLGVLKDSSITESGLIDEIFPDDLLLKDEEECKKVISRIKEDVIDRDSDVDTSDITGITDDVDVNDIIRSIIESDFGYNRSVSVELKDENFNVGTVHLRKTVLYPGTQIFIKIKLNSVGKINLIKIKLECVESYPKILLKESNSNSDKEDQKIWRDSVKEVEIFPGFRDEIETIFPIPPELPTSISCSLFELKWELNISFMFNEIDVNFDLKIPLKFIPFKFELNK